MQTNILWTGREYYSLENCLITNTEAGFIIHSVIVGQYENKLYKVNYQLKTNLDWETLFLEVHCHHHFQTQSFTLVGDGKGNWSSKELQTTLFKGCIDVDIPLTPFTNTLPINRLRLNQNQFREIQVIYLDLLQQQIVPVKQKYTCLSPTYHHYQNVPNDFEATIQVDDAGFVVDYPDLFVRTMVVKN